MARDGAALPVLRPDLQVSFYRRFKELEAQYLHSALKAAIEHLDITLIDRELAQFVNPDSVRRAASFGLKSRFL